MRGKRRPERIILIGFMGTGKTHWARRLARRLKWTAFDCDSEIEKKEKRSIVAIFGEAGEAYFRKKETTILRRALGLKKAVIATGGGAVLSKSNRRLIKEKGLSVWLKTPPALVWKRVGADRKRPLLAVADPRLEIRRLLKKRSPLYRTAADEVVRTGGSKTVSNMTRILKKYGLIA